MFSGCCENKILGGLWYRNQTFEFLIIWQVRYRYTTVQSIIVLNIHSANLKSEFPVWHFSI